MAVARRDHLAGADRGRRAAAPGARRWYRATACDANRNCGSATAGPVAAGGGGTTTLLASARPALSSVSAERPRACGTCLRIAFTAKGRGPLAWVADVWGAGIRLRRDGRFSTARRHTVQVRLPRLPTCGGRVTVTLRLTSSHGQAKVLRTIWVKGKCRSSKGGSKLTHHGPGKGHTKTPPGQLKRSR